MSAAGSALVLRCAGAPLLAGAGPAPAAALVPQYITSASLMLPKGKLNVLASLLAPPPPSLFFLFQFNKEAELWPLAPPRKWCRALSSSVWGGAAALLSTCRRTSC